MTYPQAKRVAHAIEPYDVSWLEEPLPAEDVAGHRRLSESTSIPIAVGESMYAPGQFAEYVQAGAAGVLQVDAVRIGGITPWLKVAHMAKACNLGVSPHFLMELHLSLVTAIRNGMYIEYIPQLTAITRSTIRVVDGMAAVAVHDRDMTDGQIAGEVVNTFEYELMSHEIIQLIHVSREVAA